MTTRNFEELCKKYSGPCFIIGSGPSLFYQDLDFLKNYRTIAVNAGLWRFRDADIFCTDDEDSSSWSYFYDILRKSEKTQVLLYEEKFKKYGNWAECVEWFGDRLISFHHRKGYYLTDEYKHNDPTKFIWQCRTSLASAVHCAWLMGHDPIILLGVDCIYHKDKRHFYELGGEWTIPQRRKPFPQKRFIRKIGQNRTDNDLVEILEYWEKIMSIINNSFRLYNASEMSIIKSIPKINLEDFRCPTKTSI